jgi:perosamine synthetase
VSDFIPVCTPVLDGNELRYVTQCVETGWISSEGDFVRRLEDGMARHCARRHGIAVSSGTAALEAAMHALGIGPGDEVILPTFCIISCAGAVVRCGARPVVVDCLPDTWCMDPAAVQRALTAKTRAVLAVHTYGLTVDMAPLVDLARREGLALIEDAAEAHGQSIGDAPCGSFGDISIFSFYPNKLVTTGEGGMLLTDSDALAERLRELRNLCFQPRRRFVHHTLGFNWRMSNVQAALGVAQLERLRPHRQKKRAIGQRYAELLADTPGLTLPSPTGPGCTNDYWVFGVVLDDDVPLAADDVMRRLGEAGIGTRPFFWPMHEQPVFLNMGFFAGESHPVAERLARRGFYIPNGLGMTEDQQQRVARAVKEALRHAA